MPQSSYEKGGQKHYTDQFHPITANAREELNATVLDAYEQKLEQSDTLTRMRNCPSAIYVKISAFFRFSLDFWNLHSILGVEVKYDEN